MSSLIPGPQKLFGLLELDLQGTVIFSQLEGGGKLATAAAGGGRTFFCAVASVWHVAGRGVHFGGLGRHRLPELDVISFLHRAPFCTRRGFGNILKASPAALTPAAAALCSIAITKMAPCP